MNKSVQALTESDKQKLFWASFLALAAAGVGFVFRVMIPSMWSDAFQITMSCLLYTSPSPRDATLSRMPSSA